MFSSVWIVFPDSTHNAHSNPCNLSLMFIPLARRRHPHACTQNAINAAVASGGTTVVVQPGDYHFNDVDMEVRALRFKVGCVCGVGVQAVVAAMVVLVVLVLMIHTR